jgi:hypothetical protein
MVTGMVPQMLDKSRFAEIALVRFLAIYVVLKLHMIKGIERT